MNLKRWKTLWKSQTKNVIFDQWSTVNDQSQWSNIDGLMAWWHGQMIATFTARSTGLSLAWLNSTWLGFTLFNSVSQLNFRTTKLWQDWRHIQTSIKLIFMVKRSFWRALQFDILHCYVEHWLLALIPLCWKIITIK